MIKIICPVACSTGLHARPASIFSKTASKIKSDIKMYKNNDMDKTYNPKSILSVLAMGASKGDMITLVLDGEDEKDGIEALKAVLETDFE